MRNQKKNSGLIFVISGPSGSGKTTLRDSLLKDKDLKRKLVKSVSFTTRPRRSGERQGKDYFFISEEQFRRWRKAKKILEWTKYLGYYYATPRDFAAGHIRRGRNLVLCLDLKGALRLKQLYPENTITIFVMPPSLCALRKRIRKRCNKTAAGEIRERLRLAEDELCLHKNYDYCLVNKKLTRTQRDLKGLILKALEV